MSILGSIVKAVSSAVSSAYKKKASSSSGSSSSSSKSNNSTTTAYKNNVSSNSSPSKTSNGNSSSSNIYSGMTAAQQANERAYLNNLISGGGGNAEWAKNQMEQLNAAETASEYKPVVENPVINNEYKDNENLMQEIRQSYEKQLKEQQAKYNELNNSIAEKNALAVQQGTARLEAQKTNINQKADDNARQAYVNMMMSKKALPQQLASQGVTGGATETANLGLSTNYQNNVNAINQNKANAIQEIDNAIVDLKNTGDLSTVEQVLANNQQALAAQQQLFAQQQAYNQWANEFNANRADVLDSQEFRDKQYADQMAQQQLENQWYQTTYNDNQKKQETDRVVTLLQNGMVDANSASALLGIPVSQINSFVDYINKVRDLELKATQASINNTNSTIANRNNQNQKEAEAKKLNNMFAEDYQAIKSLSYADAISHLKSNAGTYMSYYGLDGYNSLWNLALEDAIKEGVVQAR